MTLNSTLLIRIQAVNNWFFIIFIFIGCKNKAQFKIRRINGSHKKNNNKRLFDSQGNNVKLEGLKIPQVKSR